MREQLVDLLRCPACHAGRAFGLEARIRDGREVREGNLRCTRCERSFAVEEGIADLLHEPPEIVVREGAGLERFAEVMRANGWDREKIRKLPDIQDGYWYGQRVSFDQIVSVVDPQPQQTLLDVGANTCWASNLFAQRGLDVIALDITRAEMQGLRTAEYFIDSGEVYFDRLLSNMADPAIASDSLDYVFCCEVLHHNDLPAMRRTFEEIHRILKPGGKLLVLNEPMRFPLNLKRDHAAEVAQFEGNEHVHFFHQYFLGARRAGFSVRVLIPPYLQPHPRPLRALGARVRAVRRAYFGWIALVAGDTALNMICTKAGHGARLTREASVAARRSASRR